MKRFLLALCLCLTACAPALHSSLPTSQPLTVNQPLVMTKALQSLFDDQEEASKKTPVECVDEKHCVAVYHINGDVDEVLKGDLTGWIKDANDKEIKAAVIEINTPGGSVPDGFVIAKAIENSKVPITCVVDGEASSMGAYILQSCPTRAMTKRSMIMFHEPSMGGRFNGTPNEWQAIANWLEAMRTAMAEHCVHRMSISVADYHAKTDGGLMWFLTWTDAQKYHAIDRVVESVQQAVSDL